MKDNDKIISKQKVITSLMGCRNNLSLQNAYPIKTKIIKYLIKTKITEFL